MKRTIMLLLAAITGFAMQAQAQVTTKFGDNVGTLDGIIKAYYDVVTVKKGQMPSYERDSSLHVPAAMVGATGRNKEGHIIMHTMTLKRYHELSDAGLAKDGFDEHEISRKVEKFGAMYHVWSTYETRNVAGGPIIGRGINSIELYYDGKRFWILGWFYDDERKDNPLPKEYLPK